MSANSDRGPLRPRTPLLYFLNAGNGYRAARIALGAEEEARRQRLRFVWKHFSDFSQAAFLKRRAAGVILGAWGPEDEELVAAIVACRPTVSITATSWDRPIPTILPDYPGLALQMGVHFVQEGVRSIWVAAEMGGSRQEELILESFQRAAGQGGLLEKAAIHDCRKVEPSAALLQAAVARGEGPIGIFARSAQSADAWARAALAAGLRVPEHVSVAGLETGPIDSPTVLPITVVRFDYESVGRMAVRAVQQACSGQLAPFSRHQVSCRLVVRHSSSRRTMSDPQLALALSQIHENFDQDLSLVSLAKRVGLSRTRLSDRFHRLIGDSPIHYLIRYRLDLAKLMLVRSALPVSEIAYQLGYDDQSYFTRLFHKWEGVAPSVYRERMAPTQPAASAGSQPAARR